MLGFIIWDVNPEIFTIGTLSPRWYGLLFALGFLIGQQILIKIYKVEGKSEKYVETLTIYMVLATIIGARLGHCLFYEPEYFLSHPLEILYVWQGGLASHGATVGILLAIWWYSRKHPDQSYLYVLDRMVITIALAACFIRLGNLMNSEIIGKPTDASQGFIFVNSTTTALKDTYKQYISDVKITQNNTDSLFDGKYLKGVDISMRMKSFGNGDLAEMAQIKIKHTIMADGEYGQHIILSKSKESVVLGDETKDGREVTIKAWGIPRHPAQLYESLSSLLLFVLLLLIYNHYRTRTPEGILFGIFVLWIFVLRFFYEYLKENQVAFENEMTYNMGQLLSLPMIVIGIAAIIWSLRKKQAVK